jgi:hypothetical protein
MAKRKPKQKKSGQDGAGFYDDDGNWVDLEWGDGPKKQGLDPAKARLIGIGTGLAILVGSAAWFIAADNAKPRARKKVEKKEEVASGGMRHFRKGVKADTTRVATVWDFSEDILKLDRAVYESVSFILKSGRSISALKESSIDLAKVLIVLIEIDVRAKPWDALKSDDRIELLYNTYRLLKEGYPDITRQVRLVFDDKRKSLDFEFDKMFS